MSNLHVFSFSLSGLSAVIVLTVAVLRPDHIDALTAPLATLGASFVGPLVSEYLEGRERARE